MEKEKTIEIIKRFFHVIDTLKDAKVIRGLNTFTNEHDINRRNLIVLRNDIPQYMGRFEAGWLTSLIEDFKVSPTYLLTGEGSMFLEGWSVEQVRFYRIKILGKPLRKSAKKEQAQSRSLFTD